MKRLLITLAFAFTAAAIAASPSVPTFPPKQPATPAVPATPATPAAKATPGVPAECMQRLQAHAERMKKELGLTDAQVASMRNELERYHGQMMTARADHRSNVAKILTPEQNAKMDEHHAERRDRMMERCGDGDDDMSQGKGKHKAKGHEKG